MAKKLVSPKVRESKNPVSLKPREPKKFSGARETFVDNINSPNTKTSKSGNIVPALYTLGNASPPTIRLSAMKENDTAVSPGRRRIAYMHPEDFEAALLEIYGGYGHKHRFAYLIGVTNSTITRWCKGTNAIPKWVAVMVWALQHLDGVATIDAQAFQPVVGPPSKKPQKHTR